ncbi:acylneuraminate cytidylyltransferase family protein [Roseovarius pelagicus]|uniref:Acylneuraminate cytidylyltransferase family protein n=1 Tax=Roseovarius pelagicus TaxID=2980108 RepID=A0ABY6D5K1_9RHOB|nr:acylneuraminate cytidylyltransferase family protein [Roseovarius pelagicus]UXX81427.1 acylneuraminate cytidylyltransferase family protein [Roseovarius pelagicus]
MTRICTICARGGSKGLPRKNLRPLLGKPLLAWTIEQATASGLFDLIAVSSDSDEILSVARRYGAGHTVKRPDEFSGDTAAKVFAIRHCLLDAEAALGRLSDIVVDLDVTSPLRTQGDIAAAIRLLEDSGAPNVITGAPARRSPYFNLVEVGLDGVAQLSKRHTNLVTRRQDGPACFDMNAAIYVWQRDTFVERPEVFYDDTRFFEMPSARSIDVDTEVDFELLEILMRRQLEEST